MLDLRRKCIVYECVKEFYSLGEFFSGRKWGDDVFKEEVDIGVVNLIELGVCGVFVYGLEDEMYEVCIVVVEVFCMLV